MAKRMCSVDGCEAVVASRGWCSMHYARWRRTGETGSFERQRRNSSLEPCSVVGCEAVVLARGWCSKHYYRWYQYGVLTVQREPGKCKRGHERTPDNVGHGGHCKICVSENTKTWREANWARYRETSQARYARDRDKVLAKVQEWQRANPEKRREARRRRRYGAGDPETIAYVEVLRSDPCVYCGGAAGTLEHIVPVSTGGDNHWTNYASACLGCNISKNATPLLIFLTRNRLISQKVAASNGR